MKLVKSNHGGRREGAGRPSLFPKNPAKDPARQMLVLTHTGRNKLDRTAKRLTKDYQIRTGNKKARVSRTVVVESLARLYSEKLTLDQILREAER